MELAPILWQSLLTGDPSQLYLFVHTNRQSCSDPYEGQPLTPAWQDVLENRDTHELGDFALTKYYDPSRDFGLAERWLGIDGALSGDGQLSLLGARFGPPDALFDPGRMGSYFQPPIVARASLGNLRFIAGADLQPFLAGLDAAVAASRGVYVTF